ncbi:hypothetical protein C7B77_11340 [Chamaesiphon polymorphus CCALA 037]|uniref:Uncharacterized protein n=1 Tax=Chamaesiphon polymorphus CCALA 037 TaxID=2107692 RepID=A0A2T1GG49_9CYAN|nr:hypothetical protein C7B77_11340 [Chamaesiphon polymorphus CCALA 037]
MILRIVGLLCLGGAGIAGASWLNTENIMRPLSKEIVISQGKITSLTFASNQEMSERNYNARLDFDKTGESSLNCEDIKSLGVKWVISTSETVKTWNTLESTDYSCNYDENLTIIGLPAPSFKPHTNYYLHLSTANDIQNKGNINARVAIQHQDGIGTHYLFMDKALAELLGGGLLLVSFICFTIDLLTFLLKRKKELTP